MSTSEDQLKSIFQEHQKEFQTSQLKMNGMMPQKLSVQENSMQSLELRCSTTVTVVNSMSEFHFDSDAEVTFESWFERYEDISEVQLYLNDSSMVRFLLRKLGADEH